jgi:Uma2 family endonuclease
MPITAEKAMTVDEFLAWAEGRDGRWELYDGVVVAMSPERVAHLETKGEVWGALKRAIERAKAPCHAMPDGATVRITSKTAFEPDALVYCEPRLAANALEVPNPVVVVEVLSPSTEGRDHGVKVRGYFSLPSVSHYLILETDARMLIHHKRGQGDVIETRMLSEGLLRLDPPGLEIPVLEMFAPI